MIAAAVSCGVLTIVGLITLRQIGVLGDRIFDFQIYVAMMAAAIYLAAKGAEFEAYVISLATLRFVILMWDVIDLLKLRLATR